MRSEEVAVPLLPLVPNGCVAWGSHLLCLSLLEPTGWATSSLRPLHAQPCLPLRWL